MKQLVISLNAAINLIFGTMFSIWKNISAGMMSNRFLLNDLMKLDKSLEKSTRYFEYFSSLYKIQVVLL